VTSEELEKIPKNFSLSSTEGEADNEMANMARGKELLFQNADVEKALIRRRLIAIWRERAEIPRASYLERITRPLRRAGSNIARAPLTSFFTLSVIIAATLILGVIFLSLDNLQASVAREQERLSLSVFLKDNATASDVKRIEFELSSEPEVATVKYISKSEALAEFRRGLGNYSVVLDGMEADNPIPASIEVRLSDPKEAIETFSRFEESFNKHPAVEVVQYNKSVILRLTRVIKFLRLLSFFAVLVMVALTAFILSTTIHLSLYAHRDEVEIYALLGGDKFQSTGHYLFEGMVLGAVGSSLSIGLLHALFGASTSFLTQSGLSLGGGDGAPHGLVFLSMWKILFIVGLSIIMGGFGSEIAVRKFRRTLL
jgi:cell division transport system permease protein